MNCSNFGIDYNLSEKDDLMKLTKNKSIKDTPSIMTSFLLIGDDGANKSMFFDYLQIEPDELNQEINVYVKKVCDGQFF